jgi:hypothetical protein
LFPKNIYWYSQATWKSKENTFMKNSKLAFNLMWLGVGAAFGVILARRTASRRGGTAGQIAHLPAWERALAERYGIAKAVLLAAKAQARYEELFPGRPRFRNPALRTHLELSILPGIALYQVLRESSGDPAGDPAEALDRLDECIAAQIEASTNVRQARLLDGLPGGFAALRIANRVVLQARFPKEGWDIEWVEDSPQRIAYNITGCFYLNIFTAYGVPELTAHFCAGDDLIYGELKNITWGRTETLGRGDPCCNFDFRPRGVEAEIPLAMTEDA